jgi:hypothetical protein
MTCLEPHAAYQHALGKPALAQIPTGLGSEQFSRRGNADSMERDTPALSIHRISRRTC